jgi:hypothetical protein
MERRGTDLHMGILLMVLSHMLYTCASLSLQPEAPVEGARPKSVPIRVGWIDAPTGGGARTERPQHHNLANHLGELIFGMNGYELVEMPLDTSNADFTSVRNSVDVFVGVGWFLDQRFEEARMSSKAVDYTRIANDGQGLVNITGAFEAQGRPITITYQEEALFFNPANNKYDILLCSSRQQIAQCKPTANLLFPFGMFSLMMRNDHTWLDLYKSPQQLNVPDVLDKTDFCAWINKNCWIGGYRADVAVRVAFFDILEEKYKRCTTFQGHCRSIPGDSSYWPAGSQEWNGGTYFDHNVRKLRKYRFSMAFENNVMDGYVSEKIFNALLAGAIPIYFGTSEIERWINPARFINCNFGIDDLVARGKIGEMNNTEFEQLVIHTKTKYRVELEACVLKVKRLDQDTDAYRQVVQAPILLEDSFTNFSSAGATLKHIYTSLKHGVV